MSTYELLITDVTRYNDLFCVAGWDLNNGGMIRPEPPTANAAVEASRFWTVQDAGPGKFFAVGNHVRFDAAGPPANFPFPHATEDRIFIVGNNSAVLGQMTAAQIVHAVAAGVSVSIAQAFGGHLHRANSGKAHVTAGVQTGSLDAIMIQPGSISFYEHNPSPGKRQLRALIDQAGIEYDFSVPADAAKSRFLAGGVAALEADAAASQSIHVRLGLCRPFAAMPNSCYAQVNGLYFL
ncbi:dual OB domain-containing protein [Aliihoeflea sp. PC F10.4]